MSDVEREMRRALSMLEDVGNIFRRQISETSSAAGKALATIKNIIH